MIRKLTYTLTPSIDGCANIGLFLLPTFSRPHHTMIYQLTSSTNFHFNFRHTNQRTSFQIFRRPFCRYRWHENK
ncbi:uncharacterized protein EAF01_003427 [Botrytis porri]|uniref:uncharacterized protein n=1 Tax=Botrytis porri TaxID=87229 RepID=UPI0018FFE87B|nr:uncharacterized protein EAF01_003427 [Botrytis porri]KAF7909709.1 hypothetical protein EAF01_003427 [Botrytis porri]